MPMPWTDSEDDEEEVVRKLGSSRQRAKVSGEMMLMSGCGRNLHRRVLLPHLARNGLVDLIQRRLVGYTCSFILLAIFY